MSSYKLFTDKSNNFQCKIELEGASLNSAAVRLVIEGKSRKYLYEGTVGDDGFCRVPIDRLNEIFSAGDQGSMKLEVIADDAYFVPWESTYDIDTSKKVRVEVVTPTEQPKKPQLTVQVQNEVQQTSVKPIESKKVSGREQEFNKLVEYMQRKIHTTNTSPDRVKKDTKLFLERIETLVEKCVYKHNPRQVYEAVVKTL